MRTIFRAQAYWRAHRGAPRRCVFGALCFGLLLLPGCAGGPAPEEETLAPMSGIEEIARAGETLEASTDARAGDVAGMASEDLRYADESRSVSGKVSDASLAAKVQLALVDTRDLRAHRFDPEAVAGRVILRGHVTTWAQRERAAAVAARVPGVVSVSNELTSTEERPTGLAEASGLSGSAPGDAPDGVNGSLGGGVSPGGGAEGPVYHTVTRGESLWTISRKYGVGIEQIRSLNGLRSDALRSGQRLRIR